MSDYDSYNRSYGVVVENFDAWREYFNMLTAYGSDISGQKCTPPYNGINEPTIDNSIMTDSSNGNAIAAATQVCYLWKLVCSFNDYYGEALPCMYSNIGKNQPVKSKTISTLSEQYELIRYPPSCTPDGTLPSDCNMDGRSFTWQQLNGFLFSINQFLRAKCTEFNLRFQVLIQADGKQIGTAPDKKKIQRRDAIITGVVGGILVFFSVVSLYSDRNPRGGYGPLDVQDSRSKVKKIILGVLCLAGVALLIACIVLSIKSKSNFKDPGNCSLTDLYGTDAPPIVPPPPPSTDSRYRISKDWSGVNIVRMNPFTPDAEWGFSPGADIDGWDPVKNFPEPTHGSVDYGEPIDRSLVSVTPDNKLVLSVSSIPQNGRRQSIRIHAKQLYNYGVFAIDVDKIPADATTWPSFWLRGDTTTKTDGTTWSCYGEIDIIEGVNGNLPENNRNQCTLHTNALPNGQKCIQTLATDGSGNPITPLQSTDCGFPGNTSDMACGCDGRSVCPYQGCGYQMAPGSFGRSLNSNGGGIFACELTGNGRVTYWFWPRGDPLCPLLGSPKEIDTTTWRTSDPNNTIKLNACPGHFQNMALLINTTLCGDWAGNTYRDAGNSSIQGLAACQGAVNSPDFKYDDGKWVINSVKVYQ